MVVWAEYGRGGGGGGARSVPPEEPFDAVGLVSNKKGIVGKGREVFFSLGEEVRPAFRAFFGEGVGMGGGGGCTPETPKGFFGVRHRHVWGAVKTQKDDVFRPCALEGGGGWGGDGRKLSGITVFGWRLRRPLLGGVEGSWGGGVGGRGVLRQASLTTGLKCHSPPSEQCCCSVWIKEAVLLPCRAGSQ